MQKSSSLYTARETALLLVQLCAIGECLKARGFCAGELQSGDLRTDGLRIERSPPSRIRWIAQRGRRSWHLKRGHDLGCRTIGVPVTAVRGLLQHWAGETASLYLFEAIESAIAQIAAGEWSGYAAARVVKYEIGRRLTIESPADSILPE